MSEEKTIKIADILTVKTISLESNIEKLADYLLENPEYSRPMLIKLLKSKNKTERETIFRNMNKEFLKQEYGAVCCSCEYDIINLKTKQTNIIARTVSPGMRLEPCEFATIPKGEPVKIKHAWENYFEDKTKLKPDEWVKCIDDEKETTVLEWQEHSIKKKKIRKQEIEALYCIVFKKNKKYLQKNLFNSIRRDARKEYRKGWDVNFQVAQLEKNGRFKVYTNSKDYRKAQHEEGRLTFSELNDGLANPCKLKGAEFEKEIENIRRLIVITGKSYMI